MHYPDALNHSYLLLKVGQYERIRIICKNLSQIWKQQLLIITFILHPKLPTEAVIIIIILSLYEMQRSNHVFHLSSTPFTTSWERTDKVLRISPRCDVTRGGNQICPARRYFTLCWHTYSRWLLMTHNLHTNSQARPTQYIFHIL